MKPISPFSGRGCLCAAGLAILLSLLPSAPAATLADFGYQRRSTYFHVTGQRPLLLILARFTDGPLAHDTNYYHNLMFDLAQQPSVAGYFWEVSNHRFLWSEAGIVSIEVPPSERFTNVLASVLGNEGLADHLYCSNLVHRAMISGQVDFCGYDSNNSNHNGTVVSEELTIVIVKNDGGAASRGTGLVSPPNVACAYEGTVALQDHQGDFITLCHEMAHQLGTLDLYGTGDDNAALTLMSGTISPVPDNPRSWHLDPWHKMQYGWSEPRIRSLAGGGVENLPAAQMLDATAPLILYHPARGTQEYFLLEYRTTNSPVGPRYDTNVAGNGLVLWHVQQDANKDPFWLADAAVPTQAQNNWWYCDKCKGMFFKGSAGSPGPCPAGGTHDTVLNILDYRIRLDNPTAPGQHGWKWCQNCQGLFLGTNQPTSHCPAGPGAKHDGSQSGDYTLNNGTPAPYEISNWFWCNKCQGLLYEIGNSTGPCPAGATHDHTGSGNYGVPMRMIHYTVAAKGAPDLIYGGNAVWGSGANTPVLRWYDDTLAGVRISVRPFGQGAGSLTVEWGEADSWVDFNFLGLEYGTFDNPFNTLAEGVTAVYPSGILHLKTGHSPVTPSLSKPMRMEAYGGPVTLGR